MGHDVDAHDVSGPTDERARDNALTTSCIKNGETIQQWDLGEVLPSADPLQLFSPIIFRAGDVITFTVDCATVGSGNAACIDGLLMSGLSYPTTG